jgi:hypothetical protein
MLPTEDRIERSLDSMPRGSSPRPAKRKGARRITTLVACIAVAAIVSGALLLMGTGADQPTAAAPGASSGIGADPEFPHPVTGMLYDGGANPLPYTSVTITNVRLGVSNETESEEDGRYSFDLANMDGTYEVGDEILVEAVNETLQISGSATGYVTGGYYDIIDVTLDTAIPEFSTVIVPVVGMLALFAVVGLRRRKAQA